VLCYNEPEKVTELGWFEVFSNAERVAHEAYRSGRYRRIEIYWNFEFLRVHPPDAEPRHAPVRRDELC
jgi:hypothetical protein